MRSSVHRKKKKVKEGGVLPSRFPLPTCAFRFWGCEPLQYSRVTEKPSLGSDYLD